MPVCKTERIRAVQMLKETIEPSIRDAQDKYLIQRQADKVADELEIEERKKEYDDPSMDLDTKRRKFYESSSKHTPEYRKEAARFREYLDEMDEQKARDTDHGLGSSRSWSRKPKRLFDDRGRPLNVNEAGVDFHYDDGDDAVIVVEIFLYKHMDSSLIKLDVQPTYLRATIRGKVFQLR